MGLAWRVVSPDRLLDEALGLARRLAVHPVASLVASKRLIAEHVRARRSLRAGSGKTPNSTCCSPTAESRSAVGEFVSARESAGGAVREWHG